MVTVGLMMASFHIVFMLRLNATINWSLVLIIPPSLVGGMSLKSEKLRSLDPNRANALIFILG